MLIWYESRLVEHLRRMTLADNIERLLNIFENDFSSFFKTCDLNFDNFSNTFLIVFYIPDAVIIFYYTRNT